MDYQSGFGNHFSSEAIAGALPQGRNSPQRVAFDLYAELISGAAFTAPRAENRRSWMYRRQPSLVSGRYAPLAHPTWQTGSARDAVLPPEPLRWSPFPIGAGPADFIDGLHTLVHNGDPSMQVGMAAHVWLANRSMQRRSLVNADGEMLLVPQQGGIRVVTELGRLDVAPGQIALIPRGLVFAVELLDAVSRGYVCENHGAAFRLPELGPIGSNGLANPRDFQAPVAWMSDETGPHELVRRFGGRCWRVTMDHSPFNVAAWHGNLAPLRYDTQHFMVIGSISFDHPDPSIFTVLTSPSDTPGTANCDFVIFPPRWLVNDDTFRPPWFHRNLMSEFMGLVHGQYDAKAEGFRPGGASLHNCMIPHGPDQDAFEKATQVELKPHKLDQTLAFMFESRYAFAPTDYAMNGGSLDADYIECWQGLRDPLADGAKS
ncbi:homogentisate 1,2-dioxygenase [soil metagenome]